MAGGKGGTTTSKVEIPEYIEDASKSNLARADDIAKIGYVPYYGPDVAAMAPGQIASMQNTNSGLEAFGLSTGGNNYLPEPQTFAGGVQGFSSAPLFQQSLDMLEQNRPGQFNAINDMFIDPITGEAPAGLLVPDEEEEVVDPVTGQKKKKDTTLKDLEAFHNNRINGGQSNAYTTNGISDMHGSGFKPGSVIGGPNSSISFNNPVQGILDMFN